MVVAQQKRRNSPKTPLERVYDLCRKYVSFEFVKYLIFDPAALPVVSLLILAAEFVLNLFVIWRVPYTEIDWRAYMQECEGFLNGTTNYELLRGDTGPLVYPAAFVYIYSALYYITSHGQNIRLAQYIFAGIYLIQLWLVLRLYTKSRKVPPYVLVISAFTSYRIHSIYVLRLFNDPVAILFLYAALNCFLDQRWTLGSVFYSLGVGVKMNILLYAPALLLFYLSNLGIFGTIKQLFVCALVQLFLGLPFLLTYPVEYIRGSFDLGRVFEHKWTVNYRFLSRAFFERKLFHVSLLLLHITLLIVFARPCYAYFKNYVRLRVLQNQLRPQILQHNEELKQKHQKKSNKKQTKSVEEEETLSTEQKAFLESFEKTLQRTTGLKAPPNRNHPEETSRKTETQSETENETETEVSIHFDQCTQLALLPFFVCNLIGVVCARSLHYQFYVWYFHSLPYLTWSTTYGLGLRYLILGFIEFCWNTYPSTNFSSCVLHLCHLLLLIGIAHGMYRATRQSGQAVAHSEGYTSKNNLTDAKSRIKKKLK